MAINIFNYPNGTLAKFKNRRVKTEHISDGVLIQFVRLLDENETAKPAAVHAVFKDKVLTTTLNISNEAATSLYYALGRYLEDLAKKEQ